MYIYALERGYKQYRPVATLYKSTRGTRERLAWNAWGTRKGCAGDMRGMREGHAGGNTHTKKGRAAGTKDASRGRGGLLKCFGSLAH